jgi:hypothetical protein
MEVVLRDFSFGIIFLNINAIEYPIIIRNFVQILGLSFHLLCQT